MNKLKYKKVDTNRAESPIISQQFRDLLDKSAKYATLTPRLEVSKKKMIITSKGSQKTKPFNGSQTTRDPVSTFKAAVKKKTLAKYTT